jgi:hypothetical protein
MIKMFAHSAHMLKIPLRKINALLVHWACVGTILKGHGNEADFLGFFAEIVSS